MATFVLVHGTWHGGWYWNRVAPLLPAAGHDVCTPTLTGLGERAHLRTMEITYQTHIQDLINVLAYEDVRDAILVGHSYGGPLVLMVAEHAFTRVAQLVCLATAIPANGQILKETFPELWKTFHQLALAPGDE